MRDFRSSNSALTVVDNRIMYRKGEAPSNGLVFTEDRHNETETIGRLHRGSSSKTSRGSVCVECYGVHNNVGVIVINKRGCERDKICAELGIGRRQNLVRAVDRSYDLSEWVCQSINGTTLCYLVRQ